MSPSDELTRAVVDLLVAIDQAGGYCVFDPAHQRPIEVAMNATKVAVFDVIEAQTKDRP